MIEFFVPGVPKPQGSKNAYLRDGKVALVESSKTLPAWRQAVTQAAKQAHEGKPPIDEPVQVFARFLMPRPKRPRFDTPAVAPDLDKLQRALGDGMEAAGVLRNDSRIVKWISEKHYAEDGAEGVQVTVTLVP